jgi:diguanylate cyclase (GGDEF)-like protein
MKVLVIEDSPLYRKMLSTQLSGLEVEFHGDAESALPTLANGSEPMVMLVDWELPGKSGLELLEQIRKQTRKHYIYAIVLSARDTKSDIVAALATGADDYLVKPFNDMELQARIQVAFRTLKLHEELIAANERLNVLASEDPLTSLMNRRALMSAFAREVKRARRTHSSITLVMCDLDKFKDINDTLGHSVGDEVLQAVSRALKCISRGSDLVARIGGDEFLVVLSGSDVRGAVTFVGRVQERMRKAEEITSLALPVSLSFGIAEMDLEADEQTAIARADTALYEAKNSGRDQYHVA